MLLVNEVKEHSRGSLARGEEEEEEEEEEKEKGDQVHGLTRRKEAQIEIKQFLLSISSLEHATVEAEHC